MSRDRRLARRPDPEKTLSPGQEFFVRGVIAERQAVEVLEAFGKAEIACIPMKGVVHRRLLYDDPAERFLMDVDLLVRPEDFDRAATILEELGYAPDMDWRARVTFGRWKEIPFRRADALTLELHRAVSTGNGARNFSERLFREAPPGMPPFDIPHVKVMTPEQTLAALALHARDHGLILEAHQVADISRILERLTPDLDRAFLLAREAGAAFTLELLLELCGHEPPRAYRPPKLKNLRRALLNAFTRPGPKGYRPDFSAYHLRFIERSWRLLLHGWVLRDDLSESLLSQKEHFLFEFRALLDLLHKRR